MSEHEIRRGDASQIDELRPFVACPAREPRESRSA